MCTLMESRACMEPISRSLAMSRAPASMNTGVDIHHTGSRQLDGQPTGFREYIQRLKYRVVHSHGGDLLHSHTRDAIKLHCNNCVCATWDELPVV